MATTTGLETSDPTKLIFNGKNLSVFIGEYEKMTRVKSFGQSASLEQYRINNITDYVDFENRATVLEFFDSDDTTTITWERLKTYLKDHYEELEERPQREDVDDLIEAAKDHDAVWFFKKFESFMARLPTGDNFTDADQIRLAKRAIYSVSETLALLAFENLKASKNLNSRHQPKSYAIYKAAVLAAAKEPDLKVEALRDIVDVKHVVKPMPLDPKKTDPASVPLEAFESLQRDLKAMHVTVQQLAGNQRPPPSFANSACHFCKSTEHRRSQCPLLDPYVEKGEAVWDGPRKMTLYFPDGRRVPLDTRGQQVFFNGTMTTDTRQVIFEATDDDEEDYVISLGLETSGLTYDEEQVITNLVEMERQEEAELVYQSFMAKRTNAMDVESLVNPPKKVRFQGNVQEAATATDKRAPPKFSFQSNLGDTKAAAIECKDALLNTPVSQFVSPSLTLRNLLAASPMIAKEIAQELRVSKVPLNSSAEASVHAVGIDGEDESDPAPVDFDAPLFPRGPAPTQAATHRALPTGKLNLEVYGVALTAEYDPGSMVNIMSAETASELNLPFQSCTKYRMRAANMTTTSFLGICEDVTLKIGGLSGWQTFMIANVGYPILLGKPFSAHFRASDHTNFDGTTTLTLRDPDPTKSISEANSCTVRVVTMNRRGSLYSHDDFTCARVVLSVEPKWLEGAKELYAVLKTKYKPREQKVKPQMVDVDDGVEAPKWLFTRTSEARERTKEELDSIVIGEGGGLKEEEVELFRDLVEAFSDCFGFTDSDVTCLSGDVCPPHIIRTVEHQPWSHNPFPLPVSLEKPAIEMLKRKLETGVLEPSLAPYASKWFFSKKPNGSYRFLIDLQPLNAVTVRDMGIPPLLDRFSEEFAGQPILSTFDLFSGYDQLPLDERSRNLTTIRTPLGPLRMTRLAQGGTNSVSAFQRSMTHAYSEMIPDNLGIFIDDFAVKNETKAKDETLVHLHLLGKQRTIRRYVYDHYLAIHRLLTITRRSNLCLSGTKSRIGVTEAPILGHLCTDQGRLPAKKNVSKLEQWKPPSNVTQVRGFLGLGAFYKIWIPGFAGLAEPLYRLLKKGAIFTWGEDQRRAFAEIKEAVSSAAVLRPPDYDVVKERPLVLSTDAGPVSVGAVLGQDDESGRRYACRYYSALLDKAQRNYPQVKRELLGIVKSLKACQVYLIGQDFVIETDCLPVIGMINKPDVCNAVTLRWTLYIRGFNPTFKHIPGKENLVADALSRMEVSDDEEEEDKIEDYLDLITNAVKLTETEDMPSPYREIRYYLMTLERPRGMADREFKKLREQAFGYLVREGTLYKRANTPDRPPRRCVFEVEKQGCILREAHDECGHKGVQATRARISERYYWPLMFEDVKFFVKTCEACQKRDRTRVEEPLYPTYSATTFEKVLVDVVHMPVAYNGYRYIIAARDDLSGWIEAKMVKQKDAKTWVKFVENEVLYRYGNVKKIVTDGGELSSALGKEMCERHGVQLVIASAYHPQSNSVVERGHAPIADAIAKACSWDPTQWPRYFYAAIWADRITVKRSTGYTPYRLIFGKEALIPVDFLVESWQLVEWRKEMTTAELLVVRTKQLACLEEDLEDAAEKLKIAREKNKEAFDQKKRMRKEELGVGDLVLLFDSQRDASHSRKLDNFWLGPYKITRVGVTGYYRIAELDGTEMKATIAGNRLKRFHAVSDIVENGGVIEGIAQGTVDDYGPGGCRVTTLDGQDCSATMLREAHDGTTERLRSG